MSLFIHCTLLSPSPSPFPLSLSSPSEQSQSDYVLFQACSIMREGLVREWEVLGVEEKEALRGYILHYITSRTWSVVHVYSILYVRQTLHISWSSSFLVLFCFPCFVLFASRECVVRRPAAQLDPDTQREYCTRERNADPSNSVPICELAMLEDASPPLPSSAPNVLIPAFENLASN